jgi:hypothetical protein
MGLIGDNDWETTLLLLRIDSWPLIVVRTVAAGLLTMSAQLCYVCLDSTTFGAGSEVSASTSPNFQCSGRLVVCHQHRLGLMVVYSYIVLVASSHYFNRKVWQNARTRAKVSVFSVPAVHEFNMW